MDGRNYFKRVVNSTTSQDESPKRNKTGNSFENNKFSKGNSRSSRPYSSPRRSNDTKREYYKSSSSSVASEEETCKRDNNSNSFEDNKFSNGRRRSTLFSSPQRSNDTKREYYKSSSSSIGSQEETCKSSNNSNLFEKNNFSNYRRSSRPFSSPRRSNDTKYEYYKSPSSSNGSCDEEEVTPNYRNHQLLGDSQFVRFSKQIMKMKGADRSIGYCVSGQKIDDLYSMLVSKKYKLHNNVILMIGTNDLRQNLTLTRMKEMYTKVLKLLKESTDNIVLVTIPPILCMADSVQHWRTFEGFNKFILEQSDDKQVFVLDFGQHLVGYGGHQGCTEYYEEKYASTGRKDLMHLNKKGFLLLQFLLDLHYFNRIY